MKKHDIENILPLTPVQEGILFHAVQNNGSDVYYEQYNCTIKGSLELEAFKRAWQEVIDRHAVLRTQFLWENREQPLQIIKNKAELNFHFHDFTNYTPNAQKEQTKSLTELDERIGFDLKNPSLLRIHIAKLSDKEYFLIWSFHHIILDGWCLGVVLNEVSSFYNAFVSDKPINIYQPKQYKEYIGWLKKQKSDKSESFWRHSLEGFLKPTRLNIDKKSETSLHESVSMSEINLTISKDITQQLINYSKGHKITLNTLFQSAWSLMLHFYSNKKDIVHGTTVSTRPVDLEGAESILGLFINTIPVRSTIDYHKNVKEWLEEQQNGFTAQMPHINVPLQRIMAVSELNSDQPLFETLVVFENYPFNDIIKNAFVNIEIDNLQYVEKANFPLTIVIVPGNEYLLRALFDMHRFNSNDIKLMLNWLTNILEQLIIDPERKLSDVYYLRDEEQEKYLTHYKNKTIIEENELLNRLFADDVSENNPIYILNDALKPLPENHTGKLYIGVHEKTVDYQNNISNPYSIEYNKLLDTGLLANWVENNELSIISSDNRVAYINGTRIQLTQVDALILEEDGIENCAVYSFGQSGNTDTIVAYIVANKEIQSDELKEKLLRKLSLNEAPIQFVNVATIPYDTEGKIDFKELAAVEIIDNEVILDWQKTMEQSRGVDDVVVHVGKRVAPIETLHISDLIDDWKEVNTGAQNAVAKEEVKEETCVVKKVMNPSVCQGEKLDESVLPSNLGEVILRAAMDNSGKGVTFIDEKGNESSQSYAEILLEAKKVLNGFRKSGLKPKDKIIFQLKNNKDFITAFWACQLGGFIPVPLAVAPSHKQENNDVKKLKNAWVLLDRPAIIADNQLKPVLDSLSSLYEDWNANVIAIEGLQENEPVSEIHSSDKNDVAILLLTSGSTGMPKAVMQTNINLIRRTAGTSIFNGHHKEDISFNWMPLDHVGGIVMFTLRDTFNICQHIVAPTNYVLEEPLRWLDIMTKHKVSATWAPNFAYALVNDSLRSLTEEKEWDLSNLRFILNAGEAIVAKTARLFMKNLLPYKIQPTAMNPCWGMSETCSGVTFNHNFLLETTSDDDPYVIVGEPIPGFKIRITDNDGHPVEEGETGNLEVKGTTVTIGYFNNESVNKESYTSDGWFRTGDLGILKNRSLVIAGRKKDEIIINGINYNNAEIELVVDEIDEVETSFSAVCAFRENNSDTDKLALFFCPKNYDLDFLRPLLGKIKERVIQNIGVNLDIIVPVEKDQIPKTGIGKIQRAKLKDQLLAGEFDKEIKKVDILFRNNNTLPKWFFKKAWIEKAEVAPKPLQKDSIVVVFDNPSSGASGIRAKLEKHCGSVILVEKADVFQKHSDSSFKLNPGAKNDYEMLMSEIHAQYPSQKLVFLHLWTIENRKSNNIAIHDLMNSQNNGVLSILFLIQALEKHADNSTTFELYIVSELAQLVGLQSETNFAYSTLFGLIKTAKHEIPWLNIRHIDLDKSSALTQINQIWNELNVFETRQEIAYRKGKRHTLSLKPVNLKNKINQPETLKKESLYLVTGGLGGLGTDLILMLARKYQMRFLIVGKTAMPDRESWKQHLSDDSIIGKRIKSVQRLEEAGVEFDYQSLNISNEEQLSETVVRAEKKWNCQLAGIFHLAGEGNLNYHWSVMEKHQLVTETAEMFHNMFEPKVYGTFALFKLIEKRPQLSFINFSSINGLFGGSTFSAYSSANSFQDTFCEYLSKSGYNVHCLSWSMWDNIGMSENNPDFANEASKGMGYSIIPKQKGFNSLLAGIKNYQGHLIVGLDSTNKNISKLIAGKQDLATKQLVVFYTGDEQDETEIVVKDKINNAVVAELVQVDDIKRDSDGHIDLAALEAYRQKSTGKAKENVVPSTPTEKRIAAIWRDVLEVSELSVNDNFFELGGHSLKATQVISRIKKEYEIELPLTQLFQNATIKELSVAVEKIVSGSSETSVNQEIKRIEDKELIPLSYAQQRLWFLKQYEPESAFYNIPEAVRFHGKLKIEIMQQCIDEIIRRHESLRTVFQYVNGQVVQVIRPFESLPFEWIDLSNMPAAEREQKVLELAALEAGKNFFIDKGPLIRIVLVKMDAEDHVIFLTMHHIISDGWSMGVFVREFMELFAAFSQNKPSTLPELTVQYSDFSIWQRGWFEGEVKEEQLKYWKNKIGNDLSTLALPLDKPRPLVETHNGKRYYFTVPKEDAAKLAAVCKQTGATLYMVLLAAFKTLLSRYSGQDDIVVGSSIANRNHREIESLIGFFVNSLVLRTDLSGSPSFVEVIERVKQTAVEAYANQDIPFEMLVEELEVKRDLSRNPLFQVMFALQNQSIPELEMEDLVIKRMEIDNHSSMFDMWLSMNESPDGVQAICEYNTDLWEEATIQRMMDHFMMVIKNACANPNQKIAEIEFLTAAENEQLKLWNNTTMPYPKDKCAFSLFEEKVAIQPDKVAVKFEGKSLTYRELDEKANQLAHHLIHLGVQLEDTVGICVNRSLEMLVALIAVNKSGAAYIPLDPVYPKDRIALILEDANPKVFITQQNLLDSLPVLNSAIFYAEPDTNEFASYSKTAPEVLVSTKNLAYVIYTSGSTGKPKGVQIDHYNLVNFLKSMSTVPGITQNDIWLAVTTVSFDISGLELFLPLIEGATIEIANAESTKDAFLLMELIESSKATIMQATPATWRMLLMAEWNGNSKLKVLCGGEAFPKKLASQLLPKVESLWNMYGPTETTIWSTIQEVDKQDIAYSDEGYVNIGKPIGNTQIYIVDQHMNILPVGVPGELLIGGDGLARGYFNRQDLTEEKFIQDIFSNIQGNRLYRTGDLARFLPDGKIEYINRIDNQVKIRGFRIELGEIESVIGVHEKVSNAAVIVQEYDNDENRLVAYVVKKDDKLIENNEEYNNEQVEQWESVFDNAYLEPEKKIEDPTFNILCWYSSYTGKLIPEIEMREWLDITIQNILDFKPKNVLEIGCGTGLILFRVAPHCETYTGTDIAKNGLDYINAHAGEELKHKISLFHRNGNDFSGFEEKQFDTIVINSVIQYFPNIEYLNEVIQKAMLVLKPGGRILIGDVRSLPLLETYHTSVELHKADDSLTVEELKKRIHSSIEQENELLINPGYFYAIKAKFPQVNKIRIFPRKGTYHNELSKFRYQAVIQVGESLSNQQVEWWDWKQKQLSLPLLQNLLKSGRPDCIGISNIPNARLVQEEQARRLIEQKETPKTIGKFRELIKNIVVAGIDPEDFYAIADDIGYHVEFDWSRHGRFGEFDVVLISKETHKEAAQFFKDYNFIEDRLSDAQLNDYANNPLQWKFNSEFVPELKKYLADKLPEYMVPSFFVLMNELPLTPNGKLNRNALPAPENNRKYLETVYQAPSNETEQKIAEIWQDILHVDKVGTNDNFFDLGGQSLSMVLVHTKLRELFRADISVVELFQYPTISALANYLDTGEQVSVAEKVSERVENRKEAMKKKQDLRKQKLRG